MTLVDRDCMNPLVRSVPLLLAALSGCLELEQTITIGADGSGGQEIRLSMTEAALTEIKRAAAAAQTDLAANPLLLFDRTAVERELRQAGLELVKHDVETGKGPGKGHRAVTLATKFASIDALRRSPLCGAAAEWDFTAGPVPGTVQATLYPQGRQAWLDARAKADRLRNSVDAVAADFFRKRQQQLDGLDICIRFRLPGDVLRHTRNLEQTGPREVTARVTAAQIQTPEDLVRRLAPRFEVVFDAAGCKLPVATR
jgi:hypothetical protein